jgi:cytochrome c biogenesis protein CcdA
VLLRLFGIVVSIGLADSMNPSTIAPGLYLAVGDRARSSLIQFTLAVFAVNFVGGAVIALGPGQVILHLVPHPHATARYVLETIAGVVMLSASAVLWVKRKSLRRRELPSPSAEGKSAILLGLTISAVELPTAFPYFAAIAAIVGSGLGPARDLVLLVLFNLCFVSPLLGILAVLTFKGEQADQVLSQARGFLQRHWPAVLAGLALLAGLFVVTLGLTGLANHNQLAHRIHTTLGSG